MTAEDMSQVLLYLSDKSKATLIKTGTHCLPPKQSAVCVVVTVSGAWQRWKLH